MILPISALARSSCNFAELFLKQQDRTARRLSGPVFLRRETKKNDFFSVLALSVSHCSTSYSLFLALPFSPNRRKSAKGRTLGKTGSFAVLPKPLTLRKDSPRSGRDVASATEWGMWHCGAMTERARPLTIKFYPDLTQSWFQPRLHTAILSLSKVILLKIWRNCLFFAEIFFSNGNCKTIGQGFIL